MAFSIASHTAILCRNCVSVQFSSFYLIQYSSFFAKWFQNFLVCIYFIIFSTASEYLPTFITSRTYEHATTNSISTSFVVWRTPSRLISPFSSFKACFALASHYVSEELGLVVSLPEILWKTDFIPDSFYHFHTPQDGFITIAIIFFLFFWFFFFLRQLRTKAGDSHDIEFRDTAALNISYNGHFDLAILFVIFPATYALIMRIFCRRPLSTLLFYVLYRQRILA